MAISALTLILLVGQVRVYFGWYNYTNVRATIADKNWMGAPYIVKEVNFQNRCFEDGHIFRKPYKWNAEALLADYPYFMTQLSTPENIYYSDGRFLELCMEIVEEKIDTTHKNWLSQDMVINYKIDVQWEPLVMSRFNSTDDYEIKFSCNFSSVGLGSSEYKKQQIREFVIRRALDSVVEYGDLNDERIQKLYPALLAE